MRLMTSDSTEYKLFTKAIDLTNQMISHIQEDQSEYVVVTKLMIERGKIYSELDLHIKTLDRSKLSDKENVQVKERYDELMSLDHQFRNLLKSQADRLRTKSGTAVKDKKAHSSYSLQQPKHPKESLFISSKIEG
jgi:hypothetical protein